MRLPIVFFLSLVLTSCGEVKRLDTSKIKERMEGSKVKQVRPNEMIAQVRKLGRRSQKALSQVRNCEEIDKEVNALKEQLKANVELIDLQNTSLEHIKDEKEKMLVDAYLYAFGEGETLSTNAQKLNNGNFVYSFGLSTDSLACDSTISSKQYFWKITWPQEAIIQSF